jgi:large subunit ribosomal protein L2
MKKLKTILVKKSGRAGGRVSVRHQGGRAKRFLREIEFKRDKTEVWGKVETVEYDPNRSAQIARVLYTDGERRYILAPDGLKVGQKIISSAASPVEVGHTLPLEKIPIGTTIHNLEIKPGAGGRLVKSAGAVAVLQGKEEAAIGGKAWILVRLPSGELRRLDPACLATVGQVGRIEFKTLNLKKAGRKRRLGIRPRVRGTAMHPHAHPHGGGEGRSSVGLKYPKTVYGRPAVGKTRNKKRYSNRLILERRKKGPHS